MNKLLARCYLRDGDNIRCGLCPHNCLIQPDKSGICRTRVNKNGALYLENYGACTAVAVDPIEKKPLYHFYPGADILSLGSWGCNFNCRFCQNWQLAQQRPASRLLSPKEAVKLAAAADGKNIGLAYTYSEPVVWFEFIADTAAAVKAAGMVNVIVTNGFINQEPLRELLGLTDAMNIDLKAFSDDFYRQVCGGSLNHVQHTIELAARSCHIEVTTLLVPGMNDSEREIRRLVKWLASLNPDIPLHISRYFPNYQLDLPPTPIASLQQAWQTAREYLNYVYLGNTGQAGIHTNCPQCGILLIDRLNRVSYLTGDSTCPKCGTNTPVVGKVMF